MDTAPLKSFATRARTDLITEVSAGIRRVLAPASWERVEQPGAVAALEKAVAAAGGGEAGRAAIADKVAYTWFNRIIALRFMDANGYTGVGVVSPARGQQGGQPEILAEAKRGTIDTTVVTNKSTVETVMGLLDGTRRSDDPQGEAYAYLLAEYCRHWNRAMPFMFEREGDYTELLIPANLLADDSVLARAVATLTEDVCQDVEVIGWLYQFYISERKEEVFAGFKKNKKAGAAEIPAATQLFTPHWIVRYLVENSLGRLWLLNRPTSRLAEQMDYYIKPVDEETDFLKVTSPEELKIIDPACGSGHMLTYAFDLLYAIYEEEGYAPSDIPGLILTHNLYGTEIDPRAGALAAFALTMKARARQRTFFTKQVQPNICVLEPITFTPPELDLLVTPDGDRAAEEAFWNAFEHADIFGSLIQPDHHLTGLLKHLDTLDNAANLLIRDILSRAHRVVLQTEYLSPRYSVFIANPPYMGARNMGWELSLHLGGLYADAKQNLYGAFVYRGLQLAGQQGALAMVVGDEWMTASTYERFREMMLRSGSFSSLLHLRDSAYHADKFGANVAFAMNRAGMSKNTTVCVRLEALDGAGKEEDLLDGIANPEISYRHTIRAADIEHVPGIPFAYSAAPEALKAFREYPSLASQVALKAGISTGDNLSFEREWYEVSHTTISPTGDPGLIGTRRWTPCSRGVPFRRWYGGQLTVMDWERDGERIRAHRSSAIRNSGFQGRAGLTFSKIGSGRFSVRELPPGFVFDDTGRMMFPAVDADRSLVLGLVNSSTVQYFLDLMSPGTAFTSTEIGRIPLAGIKHRALEQSVSRAVEISRADWESSEISREFPVSPLVRNSRVAGRPLEDVVASFEEVCSSRARELAKVEETINISIASAYGLESVVNGAVAATDVSLIFNPAAGSTSTEAGTFAGATCVDLISYAVGCMFGRYSLDEPGLILANQGETLQGYLARVPSPKFQPDRDNVLPIVDGDWFEDDIVTRFRKFLRVAFGEQHFEENLRFVTESLGVKDLRDYFVRSFYKDHVQRYKKRPIYWLFSSPKGSFNALIYMHRYTPSTVSTVLNEYLREFKAKLEASRQHQERLAAGGGTPRQQAAALKEVDRLRKVLLELEEYEHDVLYPLATRQVDIDLDDGVKANYPKFGAALKKIPGLEASDE